MEKKALLIGEAPDGRPLYQPYYVYRSPVYVHFGLGVSCQEWRELPLRKLPTATALHERSMPVYQDERGQYAFECRLCGCWHVSDTLPYGAFSVILREDDEWDVDNGLPF